MPTRFDAQTTPDEFWACHRLLNALLPAHRLRALLSAAGSPSGVFALSQERLVQDPAVALTAKQAERLREAAREPLPPKLPELASEMGIWVIQIDDPDYPRHLTPFTDAPPLLFVRGDLNGDDGNAVAIVGSRRATNYGFEQAGRFARVFAEHGLTLISGGAIGIDTAEANGQDTEQFRPLRASCVLLIGYQVRPLALCITLMRLSRYT